MRLITRLDFDGVVSTAMIKKMETIHEIAFANPKEVEERMVDIDFGDAIAHLPFHPDARLWFHNHDIANINPALLQGVRGKFGKAPSAARNVYEYYDSADLKDFESIVGIVDRIGTADLSEVHILSPKGWMLVSYTLDPRFVAEYSYGMLLIESLMAGKSADEVLAHPDVQKRVDRYNRDEEKYAQTLKDYTQLLGNVIVTDFRDLKGAPQGNRFYVFTQYTEGNVHIRVDTLDIMRVKMSVSKSVLNRTCKVDIGQLMAEFGGGGIEGAGTCLLGKRTADDRIAQIIEKLKG